MAPASGMHVLSKFLGIVHYKNSKEFLKAQSEYRVLAAQLESAQARRALAKRRSMQLLTAAVLVFLLPGMVLGGMVQIAYEPKQPPFVVSIISFLVFACPLIALLAYSAVVFVGEAVRSDIAELLPQVCDRESESRRFLREYEVRAKQMFSDQILESGFTPRSFDRSRNEFVIYCQRYAAFISVEEDSLFLLLTKDCRSTEIQTREVSRRVIAGSTTESARGNAVRGAIIGGLLLGESGWTPGAIVGSSGERSTSTRTSESVKYNSSVTIYTIIDAYPMMVVDFKSDEHSAKEFYAVISMNVQGTREWMRTRKGSLNSIAA